MFAMKHHEATLFDVKAWVVGLGRPLSISGLICFLSLLASTINEILYFSVPPPPRLLTTSVFSCLCCYTHTEIRRSTVISTVMPERIHQQLSLKSQQKSLLLPFLWTETWPNQSDSALKTETNSLNIFKLLWGQILGLKASQCNLAQYCGRFLMTQSGFFSWALTQ